MRPDVSNRESRPKSDAATGQRDFLDIAGAAAYLGVKASFIRRLVLEKRVRYYKVGKLVRFRAADLDAFLAAGIVDPEPDINRATMYSRRR